MNLINENDTQEESFNNLNQVWGPIKFTHFHSFIARETRTAIKQIKQIPGHISMVPLD